MNKRQLYLSWEKVIRETHKRSILGDRLKDKNIILLGELLLYAQALLTKIEANENVVFNSMIYKKTMNFYCTRMKNYV